MLAIKLQRQGKKHQASYRVVVAEKRSKLGGRGVSDLGWFNPHNDKFELNKEEILRWMKVGAKPTATVHNLLVRAEVLKDKKISVHKKFVAKAKEPVTEAPVAVPVAQAPVADLSAEASAKAEAPEAEEVKAE
ncbi:MAG: 30S ribosomal protein S16 [Patescibacteria group bacterium]